VNRLEGALDPTRFGALDETQLRQHFHIVMNTPNIARYPARELAHRHRSLPLQGMHQSPAA